MRRRLIFAFILMEEFMFAFLKDDERASSLKVAIYRTVGVTAVICAGTALGIAIWKRPNEFHSLLTGLTSGMTLGGVIATAVINYYRRGPSNG